VAAGICCSYLSGTAEWYRKKVEINIKGSKDFKEKKYANFKSSGARKLRDSILSQKSCCFLHEAYRYRGKSNYRDITYLTYTSDMQYQFIQLMADLDETLEFFIKMAMHYCCMRIKKETFNNFITDVSKNILLKDVKEIFDDFTE